MSVGLPPDQFAKLLDHLNEKWGSKDCPMCRSNKWTVDGLTVVNLQNGLEVYRVGGPLIPMASMTCSNCGNVLFINLLVAGVYESDGGR